MSTALLLSVVLGSISPCVDAATQVSRAALDVYLDPSDFNREAETVKISETLVAVAGSYAEKNGSNALPCLRAAFLDLSSFADAESFLAQVDVLDQSLVRSYEAALKRAGGDDLASAPANIRGIRAILRQARAGLEVRRPIARSGAATQNGASTLGDCVRREEAVATTNCIQRIQADVIRGDKRVTSVVEAFRRSSRRSAQSYAEAWSVWLKLKGVTDSRAAFALHVIEHSTAGESSGEVSSYLRKMLMDAHFRGEDPRKWEPADVAVVVWAIRRSGVVEVRPKALSPHQPEFSVPAEELMDRLKRFGVVNALELLDPDGRSVSILRGARDRYSEEQHYSILSTIQARPHFAGELELYSREWDAQHGSRLVTDGARTDYDARRQVGLDRERHVMDRWLDTDSRAPVPELSAVKAELRALESAEAKAAK